MPSIELNNQQYRKLCELLFLGDWIANANKVLEEEKNEDYKLQQYIYNYSPQFGAKGYIINRLEAYQDRFTSQDFEDALMPIIERYDEYSFWQQLAIRLADRDLFQEIGPVKQLNHDHLNRRNQLAQAYENEFDENGLAHVTVNSTLEK